MNKERRNFNKSVMLAASILSAPVYASSSLLKPNASLFERYWEDLSKGSPNEYLAKKTKSAISIKQQIKNQFIEGKTMKVRGLVISHIELASLAALNY